MSSAPPTVCSTGWAIPALLRASPTLRSCALHALMRPQSDAGPLPPVPTAAMAASLALRMSGGSGIPTALQLQAAGEALQALVAQHSLPSASPMAIFLQPYSPIIAALPPDILLALLRGCLLCALPDATLNFLLACTAQRYASLPPVQFETEVGGPSPHTAGLVRDWWLACFSPLAAPPQPSEDLPHEPLCFCSYLVTFPSSRRPRLPRVSFGLLPDSPAADFWARGLDSGAPLPPPSCAAQVGSAFGQAAWVRRHWPTHAAAAACTHRAHAQGSPAAVFSSLVTQLRERGAGDAALAHVFCLKLWATTPECASSQAAPAVAVLVGVLQAHPEDGCIAQSACAAVGLLVNHFPTAPGMGAAQLAALPAVAAVLCAPALPAAASIQAALCLWRVLVKKELHFAARTLAAGLTPRLVELLQWRGEPRAQLEACRALSLSLRTEQDVEAVMHAGALPPLVSLLDSPEAALRELAVLELASMASVSSAAREEALGAAGVVPPLLRALNPHATSSFVLHATRALSSLVSSSSTLAAVSALVPRLAGLLTAEEPRVLENVLRSLSNISSGRENRQTVLEAGCLTRTAALLGHADRDVARQALFVLYNLTIKCDNLTLLAVLAAGALPHVSELLVLPDYLVTHKLVCRLLSRVCAGTHRQVQTVLEECAQALIAMACSSEEGIAMEACFVLAEASCHGTAAQVRELVSMGLLQAMLRGLERWKELDDGWKIMAGLECMVGKGVSRVELLEAGVVLAVRELAGRERVEWEMIGEAQGMALEFMEKHFPVAGVELD
jgi:hypothetical protein